MCRIWGQNQPDNETGSNCMCIQAGAAHAVDCDYVGAGAVCHKQAFIQSESCPRHWYFYDGNCYAVLPEKLSQKAAVEKCEGMGALVATANSLEESVS